MLNRCGGPPVTPRSPGCYAAKDLDWYLHLPSVLERWVYNLTASNVRALYETAGWGWDAREKRAELFHPDSRFIVAPGGGFVMFRLDTEISLDEEDRVPFGDEERLVPVLYLYEIQIASEMRRRGLGQLFLSQLQEVAEVAGMVKIVCTVLKNNTPSLRFFRWKLGFSLDAISPERCLEDDSSGEEACYSILSKRVHAVTGTVSPRDRETLRCS